MFNSLSAVYQSYDALGDNEDADGDNIRCILVMWTLGFSLIRIRMFVEVG